MPGEGLGHIFKPKLRSNKASKTLLSWYDSTSVAVARQALKKPLKDKQAPEKQGWGNVTDPDMGFYLVQRSKAEQQSAERED